MITPPIREKGFFIIDNAKYRNQVDYRRNYYDLVKLNKKFPNTEKFWKSGWKLHFRQIKYMVKQGRICLDSDTADVSAIIQEFVELFQLTTYSYYTNKDLGKKHFWFALPLELQKCSDLFKSHVKSGAVLTNLDTRGFGRGEKNSKVQGAVFLRNENKPFSNLRPTPFDLLENLNKNLSSVPLALILPTKILDWTNCATPSSEAMNKQKKFYSFFLQATYVFKKKLPFENEDISRKWLRYYMNGLLVLKGQTYNPITEKEYDDTWNRCEKYYLDEHGKSEVNDIKFKQYTDRLVYWNKFYHVWDNKVRSWLKVDLPSNQEQINFVKRALGLHIKEYAEVWQEVKYLVIHTSFNTEINKKYNPIFRNGYFDENMNFVEFDENTIIPFHFWVWMLDSEYDNQFQNQSTNLVSDWLFRMFGDNQKVNDFFTCASSVLSNKSNTLWINLVQTQGGGAGKSTLQHKIRDIVGSKLCSKVNLKRLVLGKDFSTRGLLKKAMIYTEEQFEILTEAMREQLKNFLGSEDATINVDIKHSNLDSIPNTHSWISSSNHVVLVDSLFDQAFLERVLIYEVFNPTGDYQGVAPVDWYVLSKDEHNLIRKSIVYLLVEGYKRWHNTKYLQRNKLSEVNDNRLIYEDSICLGKLFSWFKYADKEDMLDFQKYLKVLKRTERLVPQTSKHLQIEFNRFVKNINYVNHLIEKYGDKIPELDYTALDD